MDDKALVVVALLDVCDGLRVQLARVGLGHHRVHLNAVTVAVVGAGGLAFLQVQDVLRDLPRPAVCFATGALMQDAIRITWRAITFFAWRVKVLEIGV